MGMGPISCGAVGSMASDMLGIPIDPMIVSAVCGYMTTGTVEGAVKGVVGHMGKEMVMG